MRGLPFIPPPERGRLSAEQDRQRLQSMVEQLLRLAAAGSALQIDRVNEVARTRGGLYRVSYEPFDLPRGYVQLWFADGFSCGISADGEMSS